jgi:hypothetical protein
MSLALQPWQLLAVILAGWVNRRQQAIIEYLRTENQVLKDKLGPPPEMVSPVMVGVSAETVKIENV